MVNALSDAVGNRQDTGISVLVLVIQLVVRMLWLGMLVALMMTTSTWRSGATDSLVFDFCGLMSVNAIGLVVSMFLRVYRVMISALPRRVCPYMIDYDAQPAPFLSRPRAPTQRCEPLTAPPVRCLSQFPSIREVHQDAGYQVLLLVNVMTSLLQYYATISAAYRMGGGRYFRDSPTRQLTKTALFGVIRSGR